MEVQDSDEEHEVPEHHEDGHQAEQEPHQGGSFGKFSPEVKLVNSSMFEKTFGLGN